MSLISHADLSTVQIEKARAFIAKQMKAARKAFVAANADYHDIVIDRNVQLLVASLSNGKQGADIQLDKEVAKARYELASTLDTGLATFDLLTVKTEKDIAEDAKFKMTAWLPAKRIKADGSVWKRGFCDPELKFTEADANRFIEADHGTFQVLRAKGLLQLMSEEEIDEFVTKLEVTFAMYFKLFL